MRNAQLSQYLDVKFNPYQYVKPISKLDQMKERVADQQNFLKETYESLKSPENIRDYGDSSDLLSCGQHLSENLNELSHLFKLADEIVEREALSQNMFYVGIWQ